MAIQSDLLPLGYHVSADVLANYARKINLPPMSEVRTQSYAMMMALERADASEVAWTTSVSYDPENPDSIFLQISGGGGLNEWRVAEDVEQRVVNELELKEAPVRFEPDHSP